MNAAARTWLAAHAGAVPPELQSRMERATDEVAADLAVGDALREAALVCLRRALPICDDRSAAFDLLAADALITAACEAAAGDPGRLDRLAEDTSPAALQPLLAEVGS